nr:phragmoplast orienting kinesin 2 [Tanacetum cinerariifolium]
NDFNSVSCKRDDFYAELLEVRKELEMAHALSEENEAIATEAKQMAETSRLYAEEKEEEVKICEKSVEELEHMVNVLESQVELVQGEAEKQRLQREELELEFQAFKQEINSVKSSDSDTRRLLNEKEKCLQEVLQRVQILEKEIVSKDSEIFTLNAKLAMSGSMTHDVLRDLLNIKLDMTTYSSIVDGHQDEDLTEKARTYKAEGQSKDEEVIKLKQQLKELVIERKGDSDTRRLLNEKEKCLQEVLQRVQILEKEIVSKDSEILQHKAHISELNLHAEAQAREYKQTVS